MSTTPELEPPVPKRQRVDMKEKEVEVEVEVDGWEDEIDKSLDSRAYNEDYIAGVTPWFEDQLSLDNFLSILRSRGYDPQPPDYKKGHLKLITPEDERTKVATKGAQLALARYNREKSKNLKFLAVSKAYYLYEPGTPSFLITFEAEEDGNPGTHRTYQTRVLSNRKDGDKIVKLCSFRPKP